MSRPPEPVRYPIVPQRPFITTRYLVIWLVTPMASSFARLRHEFAQCVGDAIAWRVGVKGAHEFAFRVHDVKVGTGVHGVVFGARSSLMGSPVGPVFLGDRGDLLRISSESDDPRIERLGVLFQHFARVAPRVDRDEERL